jgi:hypothetical protein
MRQLAVLEDVHLVEMPVVPIVPAHWLSLIFAGGKEVRLTFKVFFMSDDARNLAANVFGAENNRDNFTDFLKEYCNLVIGSAKVFFGVNHIRVGTSLPLLTRGFDELYFQPLKGKSVFDDYWCLQGSGNRVTCATSFEVLNRVRITKTFVPNDSSNEDVEFL